MTNKTPNDLVEGVDFDFKGINDNKIGIVIDSLTFSINSVNIDTSVIGNPILQFDYDLVEGDIEDTKPYEEMLGMVVEKLLREQYENSIEDANSTDTKE